VEEAQERQERFDDLAPNTRRAELERYRTFLRFCQSNKWIEKNWALRSPVPGVPGITVATVDVQRKVAWTMDEYANISTTLENWKDEYGRTGSEKAIMQHAFCVCLRYTGQRISDVSMLGPDNLFNHDQQYFINLTQIKTGTNVTIPIPDKLAEMLLALPLRGETEEPFTLKTNNRTIKYGTKFWFWTSKCEVDSNIKHWSDDIARVLAVTERDFGKFKHHSTPHTFRHFFAITMLNSGEADIRQVQQSLAHSSQEITERHYAHANADTRRKSALAYKKALAAIEGKPKAQKVLKMRKAG
jgi:integrase